jgi:hypothetical protein
MTSYLQGPWKYGKAKEAFESAKAGLTLLRRAWESWEEKRKRPRKASQTKNSFFLDHEYWGSERPISIEVSAPALFFFTRKPCVKEVLEMDY